MTVRDNSIACSDGVDTGKERKWSGTEHVCISVMSGNYDAARVRRTEEALCEGRTAQGPCWMTIRARQLVANFALDNFWHLTRRRNE